MKTRDIHSGRNIVIVGNGAFPTEAYPLYLIKEAEVVICCDGAVETFLEKRDAIYGSAITPEGEERLPDIIIGDMDSMSVQLQERFSDRTIHLTEQEGNDQTKAFKYVMEHFPDVERVTIVGATGKREDHTIGNLSLLMEYERLFNLKERGIEVESVSDFGTAFAISESCELMVGEGRSVSIFCPDNSLQIKSEGLVWPTDNVVFDNWWKATLNRSNADIVRLNFSHKSIALIILN